jgi:mono/diheme cytochrome c family protein
MKAAHGLGIGVAVTMISAGAWLGCSSSSGTTPVNDSGAPKLDSGTEVDTGPIEGGSSEAGADAAGEAGPVTWNEVWTDVVDKHCITCHAPNPDGGTAGGGLRIGLLDMSTPDAGYAALVNQPAQGTASIIPDAGACDTLADAGVAGSIRVVPGDAGASLLYLKVNGFTTPPPCSSPMPASGEIPDGGQAAVVQEIKSWINEGALP